MQLQRSSKYTWIILQLALVGLLSVLLLTVVLAGEEKNSLEKINRNSVMTELELSRLVLESRFIEEEAPRRPNNVTVQKIQNVNSSERFIIHKFYLSSKMLKRSNSKVLIRGNRGKY